MWLLVLQAHSLPSVMVYKEWMCDCITVGGLTLRKEVLAVYRILKIIQPSKLYSTLILLLNHFAYLQKLILFNFLVTLEILTSHHIV